MSSNQRDIPKRRWTKKESQAARLAQAAKIIPTCAWCGHQHTRRLDDQRRVCEKCNRVSVAVATVQKVPGFQWATEMRETVWRTDREGATA